MPLDLDYSEYFQQLKSWETALYSTAGFIVALPWNIMSVPICMQIGENKPSSPPVWLYTVEYMYYRLNSPMKSTQCLWENWWVLFFWVRGLLDVKNIHTDGGNRMKWDKMKANEMNRQCQVYVYIKWKYWSTMQRIKHHLRHENKVNENKVLSYCEIVKNSSIISSNTWSWPHQILVWMSLKMVKVYFFRNRLIKEWLTQNKLIMSIMVLIEFLSTSSHCRLGLP